MELNQKLDYINRVQQRLEQNLSRLNYINIVYANFLKQRDAPFDSNQFSHEVHAQ